MNNKQIILAFVTICIFFIIIVGLIYGAKNYELNLPDFKDIESITLENTNKKIYTDETIKKDILNTLKGNGRNTKLQSIQDSPVGTTSEIRVNFIFNENTTFTLYVYEKESRYYIEQPYNGIYEISGDEYNSINKYLRDNS